MIYLLGFVRNRLTWSIGEAERIKGSAPYSTEVVVTYQMTFGNWMFNRGHLGVFLQNLYREDLYYADREFTVWSLTGPENNEAKKGYETFSQRFRRLYPGYVLDSTMHIRAKPETPTVNLE